MTLGFLALVVVYLVSASIETSTIGMPSATATSSPDQRPGSAATSPIASEADQNYVVVVDAGSSGSRALVYQYTTTPSSPAGAQTSLHFALPTIQTQKKWQLKIEPGISTFGPKAQEVGPHHLKQLVDFAKSVVPASVHAYTPIYVYATAGMRLLPVSQQEAVFAEVCRYLKADGTFSLDGGCAEHAAIISGEKEGLYGWLTVNYLLNGFDGRPDDIATFGFLDMGGASAQIAFEPPSKTLQLQHANDLQNVTLYSVADGQPRDYHVFVTTFLGYGGNEARVRYLDLLKTTATPDASQTYSDPCLPLDLQLEEVNHQGYTLRLKGSGNWTQCYDQVRPLVNKNAPCPEEPCVFNGVHTPGSDHMFERLRFVGVSEFWYTISDVFKIPGTYDPLQVQEQAMRFCSQPWSVIKQDTSNHEDRLQKQCFKTAWMMHVLHTGYGLPMQNVPEEQRHYRSVDTIDGTAVSWTLGVTLLHASQVAHERWLNAKGGVDHGGSSGGHGSGWILFLMVGGLAFVAVRWFTSKQSGSGNGSGVQQWLNARRTGSSSYQTLRRDVELEGGGAGPFPLTTMHSRY